MSYTTLNPRPTPTQERLKELLDYDHLTGLLTWISGSRSDLIGKPCGNVKKCGYVKCKIDGINYAAHRIIYKWMKGQEPNIMDHINGNRADNRWGNLRSVTPQQNNLNVTLLKNNKSGITGVFYHEKQNRYHSNVRIDGKSHHLGSFATKAEAIAARQAANIILGFSDRHGKVA